MKLIIVVLSVCFFYINAHSQNCGIEVSTNTSAPFNTSLPANSSFINNFDWNPDNLVGTQLTNMQYNQLMLHIMSPQQPQYYNFIYNGELPTPENGWELLLLNTGVYPNLVNLPNAGHSDLPYIALYNRYSGVLRVFANYGNGFLPSGISFDAVKVLLKFDDEEAVNGNLRLQSGTDRTLDQSSEVIQMVSIAKHPNSPGKWFIADFQVTYDPCVCYYPSRFRLNFEFIESESIELHGRGIAIEQDIINGTAVETKDYLSNFDYTGNTASGGVLMYRSLENLVDDYEAKLLKYKADLAIAEEHNAKVERNLAVINLFRQVIINGGNSKIDDISNKTWFNNAVANANDLIGDTVVTKTEIVKAAKDAFGKQFDQFISENFKKKPLPTSPSTPVATFSEMHFSGQLLNATTIDGPNFYTPGTYGTGSTGSPSLVGDELSYPIYNEKLGSFALLEAPKLRLSSTASDLQNQLATEWLDDDPSPYQVGRWRLYGQRYQRWSKNYQIQLAEDLKYTFNPTLDIKSTDVKAALVVMAFPKKTIPATGGINNARINKEKTTNVESTNRNIKADAPVKLHTTFFNEGTLFPQFYVDYSQPLMFNFDTVNYETNFFPIDAFFNNTYAIGLWNEYVSDLSITSPPINVNDDCTKYPQYFADGWCFPSPSDVGHINPPQISTVFGGYLFDFQITLKLMVDIEFNTVRSDGTPNAITQIYSYPIDQSNIELLSGTYLTPNLDGSVLDITQYPENISLTTTDFNGGYVKNCKKVGNKYTCQAWNNVFIDGSLTTSNGYSVDILAGNEIYEVPESVISPEIVRSISPLFDYSHPMPKVTDSYVVSFCQGANGQAPAYKGNQPSPKIVAMMDSIKNVESEKEIANASWDFDLFPNPTSQRFSIRVNSTSVLPVNVTMADVTGKTVAVRVIENGANGYSIELSNCEKGIYFVTVSSYGGSQTKQLIVQ